MKKNTEDNNMDLLINEDYGDSIGKEMVHLAKFEYIPNFASVSWVTSSMSGAKEFINQWNDKKSLRDKLTKTDSTIDDMLDKEYKKALQKEKDLGNDVSKLPEDRPEDYTFEFLTDKDQVSKYINDHLIPGKRDLQIKVEEHKNKINLIKYDKDGNKVKKYR